MNLGTLRRDLFGAKQLKEEGECESPFGSDKSSYESSFSNSYTPIQPEKTFPLGFQSVNDGSKHAEVNNYITTILNEGNSENKEFINYQYNHNIFSPFNFYETSLEREPLCNIPQFWIQKKLVYTEWVKANWNNFIFPYKDKVKSKLNDEQNDLNEQDINKSLKKDKFLFDTFNNSDSDKTFINSALYSPMIKCDSPLNKTSEDKQVGFKMLFTDNDDNEYDKFEDNIDTKWVLDILGEPKSSPEQRVDSINSSKDVSSKAHLKSLFHNSKFTTSKVGWGKQSLASISKKLNFNDCSKPVKIISSQWTDTKENIKEESIDVKEKWFTPAPIRFIKKSLSDITYNKESIKEVSRRLQEEANDNPNSPSKIEYKNFAKDLKDWEKDGFTSSMKNVFDSIHSLPKKMHWRILLDLADFAKRESEFSEAATLFKIVTHIQPYAYQGWLEHAKMEEELGNIERCRVLLKRGLKFIPLNDNLFLKSLKNWRERRKLFWS